jgi:hypothetical protein
MSLLSHDKLPINSIINDQPVKLDTIYCSIVCDLPFVGPECGTWFMPLTWRLEF